MTPTTPIIPTIHTTPWLRRQWPGLLIVAIAIVGLLLITLHVRRAGAHVQGPTEQELCDEAVKDLGRWANVIGLRGRDRNQTDRRNAIAASLSAIAIALNGDANFNAQKAVACDAIEVYFPDQPCYACEN